MPFLSNRIAYLKDLPKLRPGWISCGDLVTGVAPSPAIADLAAEVLTSLSAKGFELSANNLLLGPIPDGGLGIDVSSAHMRATLQLANKGVCCLSLETGGIWEDSEGEASELAARFVARLTAP